MKILLTQKVAAIAGSEFYIANVLPALSRRGHEVAFLMLYEEKFIDVVDGFEQRLQNSGIRVYKILAAKIPGPKTVLNIARLIEEQKFDIVQSNLLYADLTMSLVKVFCRTKFKLITAKHGYEASYTSAHGFDPSHKRYDYTYLVFKFAGFFVDSTFTITKGLFQLFTGLGISKVPETRVIHYGFDFDDSYKISEEFRFGSPQLVIVGRIVSFKGHKFAIEALSILAKKYPDITLVIVGWGPLEEELKALAQKLGVEKNVKFVGKQYNARDYMATSDVVLVPSISEGFGIVILEGVSVKRPVVAFDVYSPKELFEHRKEIMLAKPYDVSDYAGLIDELLSDKELSTTIAGNAYDKLKRYYNSDRMAEETIQLYEDVLGSK